MFKRRLIFNVHINSTDRKGILTINRDRKGRSSSVNHITEEDFQQLIEGIPWNANGIPSFKPNNCSQLFCCIINNIS